MKYFKYKINERWVRALNIQKIEKIKQILKKLEICSGQKRELQLYRIRPELKHPCGSYVINYNTSADSINCWLIRHMEIEIGYYYKTFASDISINRHRKNYPILFLLLCEKPPISSDSSISPPSDISNSCVYVIRDPRDLSECKIGLAHDVPARIKDLQGSGVPRPFILDFACRVKDAKDIESKLHKIFDNQRVSSNREWFRVETADVIKEFYKII